MDFELTNEQEAVRAAFAQLFDRESTPERVRAAEGTGFDAALWAHVVAMGGPTLAVSESSGGGGGTLLDLSVVSHEQGRALGSVPVIEAAVAARLLERAGAVDALTGLIETGERWTIALRPVSERAARLVPAGQVADSMVALDGDDLVIVDAAPDRSSPGPTLGSTPIASWPVTAARGVVASGSQAHHAWSIAVDEWRILTAALLVGAASAALDIAVAYVSAREQFGVAIGSFQTVAHRLADAAVEIEGARLLAREAAWAADGAPNDVPPLARMAFAFAAGAAQGAVRDCLHFHGGYGFMREYDVQLYFRRVKAWTLVLGDPAREYASVGRNVRAVGAG